MIEFLIDRPQAVDGRACPIRPRGLRWIFLGQGNADYSEREHDSQFKR